MPPPTDILVGTLYSGENEFENSKKALQEQSFGDWQHFIIPNLPNKIAHDSLYRKFMEYSDEFDIFIKYDADMVFTSRKSLRHIADLFHRRWPIDHVEFGVQDFFSDSVIMGLHAFSKRCRWIQKNEQLFVDVDPISPTPKLIVWNFPAPIADHCPNPSPFQSFHFGIHRALKTIQLDRIPFNWFQFHFQWNLLKAIWKNFLSTADRRLGFALLGADLIFKEQLNSVHYDYTNPYLKNIFFEYENLMASDLYEILSPYWQSPLYAKSIALKQMKQNPLRFLSFLIRQITDITKAKK